MSLSIAIVDYGLGNTASILTAFSRLNCRASITSVPEELANADALVLPGVGAFGEAMAELRKRHLIEPLQRMVREEGKPCLGICLGMQIMATSSEEYGFHEGLNWIPGRVVRLTTPSHLTLPHVGWNRVQAKTNCPLFNQRGTEIDFYFDHSFVFEGADEYAGAYTEYGSKFASTIWKSNIFGTQFHPEKSQKAGLRLIRDFTTYALRLKSPEKSSP